MSLRPVDGGSVVGLKNSSKVCLWDAEIKKLGKTEEEVWHVATK